MTSTTSQNFNGADADFILRSKPSSPDDVDSGTIFKVHKSTLTAASTVFNDMLSVPQPPQNPPIPIPIVDLDETAEALELLLLFIYPAEDPLIKDLADLVSVLSAAIKYDAAFVVYRLKLRLVSPHFLQSWPFRVYAIAIRFDFKDEAKLASTAALAVELGLMNLFDELKYITAYDYQRLVAFHLNRSQQSLDLLKGTSIPERGPTCNTLCVAWYENFKVLAKAELTARPTSKVISSPLFLSEMNLSCSYGACNSGNTCIRNPAKFFTFLESIRVAIDALPDTISF